MTEPPTPSWNGPPGGPSDPTPPPGGYPPPGAYPPPGPAVPPPGYPTAEDKTWALVAHFGGAVGMFIGFGCGGWVAPLIAFLAKGNTSPTVRAHAVNALNFQILWSIIGVVCSFIGCFLLFIPNVVVMIIGVVFGIIAGVKANEGELYKYPMSLSLIK
jgi:uncharacterized Tic20 family protein